MIGRAPPGGACAALLAGFLACDSSSAPTDADPADAGTDAAAVPDAGLPDLAIDRGRTLVDLAVREETFAADACELDPDEACIDAPGTRRLLHFSVETPNLGDGDLLLGRPDPANPLFQYSACHEHYHFLGYAEYRLVDAEGGEVAAGRKQAFCLLDADRYLDDDSVAQGPVHGCNNQGIQRGWADVYEADLPCQFIDVTDVADGAYTLEIELNAERTLVEKDFDNNRVEIPVELGSPDLAGPTEECPAGIDQHANKGTHRECGWTLAGTFPCPADTRVDIGCADSAACGGAACEGDPMIRICDADADNCSFPSAIRDSDDTSTVCPCALSVACPKSGEIRVYTAPSRIGEPYACQVQVEPD